jgi:hypothetical protein
MSNIDRRYDALIVIIVFLIILSSGNLRPIWFFQKIFYSVENLSDKLKGFNCEENKTKQLSSQLFYHFKVKKFI